MTTGSDPRPRVPLRPSDYGYDEQRFGAPHGPAGRGAADRYGTRPRDDEADWPTSPSIPVVPEATRPPSRRLTAIISLLFGVFGAAPASGAAHRAREAGLPSGRYWTAFLLGWLVHLLVLASVLGLVIAGGRSGSSSGRASAPASSAPASTAPSPSPSPSASPSQAAFPDGATRCSDTVAVNASTSCQFALNVETAFRSAGATSGTVQVTATSPVTNRDYTMSCVVAAGSVTSCTGGNNAVVYLR